MTSRHLWQCLALTATSLAAVAQAQVVQAQIQERIQAQVQTQIDAAVASRAQQNYTLYCAGCHRADGAGLAGSVPDMRDFVGLFLHVPEGREFLIRVPGVADAPLSNRATAELMNWLLRRFSPNTTPQNFADFTAAEVAILREHPLRDELAKQRDHLIKAINEI